MKITLDKTQRDVLHAACLLDLSGVDEIELYVRRGDFSQARALAERVVQTASLLDRIGWDPHTAEERFDLRGDPVALRRVIARLRQQAQDSLRDQSAWMSADARLPALVGSAEGDINALFREELQRSVDEDLDTRLVCDQILDELEREREIVVGCGGP